ncbi:MAG TPA: glycosyltransferase family 2 protein [Bryobacteraceae bacterium]|jgi:N-acetylglucosaminyl-diphospho-decaprenol L-rhamnosyltransferase|nr:glycosyltransferase family 2 protein [Bryobacteraceae bacterium]
MNRTGVVVVTYNSADVVGRCLDSCAGLPIVVIDNASRDATRDVVQQRPSVILISNAGNRGFAAAVNQGVEALDTELVLLLNPDAELDTPIDPMAQACTREGVGAAGGRLVDGSGQVQSGFTLRRFPTPGALIFEVLGINRMLPRNPVNRRYRCLDVDLDRPCEADQPPGAFLMFRRDLWQRLGGFDTQFHPLWFEDVDFCKRTRNLGVKIQYVPQVIARHRGGHSIARLDRGCRQVYWYVSLLKYASKHFRPYAYRGVSAAVVLGSIVRAAIEMVQWRSARLLKVYAKVAKIAGRSMLSGRVGDADCLGNYTKAVG